jgi:tRNA A-37 threonylcarbamoyl transferase component Bud32
VDDSSTSARMSLPGGVSCEVSIVRDSQGVEIVVKQALPKLKVAADWRANPARAGVEVAALRVLRELLGPDTAPLVLWEDPENHRFAMQRVDPALRNWRDELNQRRVDLATATRVGELLGQLHSRSAQRADLAVQFANHDYFEQLRIEPFFNRVAQRNPAIAGTIGDVIAALRLPGTALVHGDFSPKNMLVRGSQVVILDCEIAHWGNPRFDLGFCLMHLALDGLHKPPAGPYATAATSFLDAYTRVAGGADLDELLVRMIGCLILARLEGDSPIDFLRELDAPVVKRIAVELILKPCTDPHEAVSQLLG